MGDEKHEGAIVGSFLTGGWYVECSCGWVGPTRTNIANAARAAEEHVPDGPPTNDKEDE